MGVNEEEMGKRGGREMENYIDFKDLVGEVFLVLSSTLILLQKSRQFKPVRKFFFNFSNKIR